MTDFLGTPLEPGDEIAYVVRRGSTVTLKYGTVLAVNDAYCWVECPMNTVYKHVRLQKKVDNNIVLMGHR